MNMKNNLVKGAVTELIATFDKKEALDLGMYRNQVEFQLEAGIKGLFIGGLAGESLYLTKDELISMTKTVVEKAKGIVPIIGNIVELRPCDALAMLKAYEEAGVDAICITQPYVLGYTQDMLYRFCSELAQSTKLPVLIYNAPQTSNTLSPATVAKIANNNDNVVGYKDSTQDIIHLQSVQAMVSEDKHWECISGSDATIFPTLTVGGCGIISLISAVFPKPIIEICDLYFAGDIAGAFEKQKEILDIRTALKGAPFLAGYKYAAELIGLPLGIVRAPLSDATDQEKAKIKDNLIRLGLLK